MRVLAIVCALSATALAQTTPDQDKADKFFAEGRELLVKNQDAKGACTKFEQAIALDPTAPGVMLNLGLCYELQGKFATSLYWFRKAQFAAAEAQPALTDYENEAKLHTQQLASKVAIARVDTSQAPADVRVTIDRRQVRPEDYLRLEVDEGSVIEARAPGKQLFTQVVSVDGRTASDITIVMRDAAVGPLQDPGQGRRKLAYVIGAGGVVLWGATLAYGLIVRNRYDDTTDGHYDGADGYANAKSDLRYIGTGMFLAGTAAVGTAVVVYLTAPKPFRERIETARLVPLVAPDTVGLRFRARF